MLNNIDSAELNALINENDGAKKIITQLMDNHYETVSVIAHELRNSMTIVSSGAQLIERSDPEIRRLAGWMRMKDGIDFVCRQLADISSALGKSLPENTVFSMEALLKNIALSFAISLSQENPLIEFTSEIPPTLGEFKGDAVKIEEMILNLLINAKDSIRGKGKIILSAKRSDGCIIISCEDSGCGMSAEEKAEIFKPFITYKTDGTGLGLPFCKKTAESYNGSVEVESALNVGSVFRVLLPV